VLFCDVVYPDLVADEEMTDEVGGARKRKGEDRMWTPGGKVGGFLMRYKHFRVCSSYVDLICNKSLYE